jgi:hypothetical protein
MAKMRFECSVDEESRMVSGHMPATGRLIHRLMDCDLGMLWWKKEEERRKKEEEGRRGSQRMSIWLLGRQNVPLLD